VWQYPNLQLLKGDVKLGSPKGGAGTSNDG
jgi:hypothetical protein